MSRLSKLGCLQKFVRFNLLLKAYENSLNINKSCFSCISTHHPSDSSLVQGSRLTRRERALKHNQRKDSLLAPLVQLNTTLCFEEWKEMETDILEKFQQMSFESFPGIVINKLCDINAPFEVCYSFITYIRNSRGNVNVHILGKFIAKYSSYPECNEEIVVGIYNEIMSRVQVLDAILANFVVCAICNTRCWKDAIKIAEKTSEITKLSYPTFGSISSACFRNNEPALGWEYILQYKKMLDAFPENKVLIAVIDWCKRLINTNVDESMMEFKKFLQMLQDCQVSIDSTVYRSLNSFFESLPGEKWNLNTTLLMSGKCNCCGTVMKSNEITNEECHSLKEKFIKKVAIGSDIFLKTTPQEFRSFINFIESQKPFGIIIDGLNVVYNRTHAFDLMNLVLVVKHFAEKKIGKILVIGREHLLKKLPKTEVGYLHSAAQFFLSENVSQDDPFILMAALISGPSTKLLTNDLLRNHKFLLDAPSSELFAKWQQRNQFFYRFKKRRVHVQHAIEYIQTTQWSDDYSNFHIPLSKCSTQRIGMDRHNDWICISREKNEKSPIEIILESSKV